jgi:D-alanyl-D-alanine carboxypeptidase
MRFGFLLPLALLALSSCSASASYEAARSEADAQAIANEEAAPNRAVLVDPTDGKEPDFEAILHRPNGRAIPTVEYGVLLTGPSTYHEAENTPFPPASTNKIFTSAFVLSELGGDYVYSTNLSWVKSRSGDEAAYLTFIGAGDPSLTGADMAKVADEFAAGLHAAGITKIYGPLRFSSTDARWSVRAVPEGWEPKDLGTATGFIPDALGTLSQARVKSALTARFPKAGVTWLPSVPAPFDESAGKVGSAAHTSKPLRELIQSFVQNSINYKGEAFLRKVGELKGARSAPDLAAAGLPLLREFVATMLADHGGSADVILHDGSGLSRTSRVTATVMVNFLEAVKEATYFEDFFAALPTAGETGTLKDRMNHTDAAGRVHAKTGTLDGNYQLAGYLVEDSTTGPVYHSFAVLTDTAKEYMEYCHAAQDAAVEAYANWMLTK